MVARQIAEESAALLKSNIPPYPPPPAGSKYKRTGKLGRGITAEVVTIASNISAILSATTDAVPYAPYVIDERHQAWMHRGRWWTLQAVARRQIPTIIRRAWDRVKNWVES